MTAKIIEVLAKILEDLNIRNSSLDEINSKLSNTEGIDKQTLSAAFSFIYDKILNNKLLLQSKTKSQKNFRVLTNEELEIIGFDNYNYLLYLLNVGLIDFTDFDVILDQIIMFPGEFVTKEDINWVVFLSLLDLNSEIMPGSRLLLYSSDNIN
jgi:uncharacterized protein Smg (DUF494 family)